MSHFTLNRKLNTTRYKYIHLHTILRYYYFILLFTLLLIIYHRPNDLSIISHHCLLCLFHIIINWIYSVLESDPTCEDVNMSCDVEDIQTPTLLMLLLIYFMLSCLYDALYIRTRIASIAQKVFTYEEFALVCRNKTSSNSKINLNIY